MRVDEFDFDLPEEKIAQRPAHPRESAKLMVVARDHVNDCTINDLPNLLESGDLLIFNNTKVIPARLFGHRGEMKVEVMLNRPLPDGTWEAFARPLKRLRIDDVIRFSSDFSATVVAKDGESGTLALFFDYTPNESIHEALSRYGHMPLPPYINRADDASDTKDYQTIFAQRNGAVAAPTASLHFTDELMQRLREKGIEHDFVTLHVGAGTYQPIRVEAVEDHIMHAEWAEVTTSVIDKIKNTRKKGNKVIAVGTTVLRALESSKLQPFIGETKIFITPGYQFCAVDRLLTNFHLPKSTLLMLVSAFSGQKRMRQAYNHAIDSDYRFFSYGDACLLSNFSEEDDAQ